MKVTHWQKKSAQLTKDNRKTFRWNIKEFFSAV